MHQVSRTFATSKAKTKSEEAIAFLTDLSERYQDSYLEALQEFQLDSTVSNLYGNRSCTKVATFMNIDISTCFLP